MVTAITQAKNLKELQLEELVGSLRAHESILMKDKPPQRNKMIALKTSQSCENQDERSSSQNPESNDDYINQSEDEDDLALISRKIQRMVFEEIKIEDHFKIEESLKKPKQIKARFSVSDATR